MLRELIKQQIFYVITTFPIAQLITMSRRFGCSLLSQRMLTDFVDVRQGDGLEHGQVAWLVRSGALLAALRAAIEARHILAASISIAA